MNISIPFPLRELHRHVLIFYYLSLFCSIFLLGVVWSDCGEEDDSEVNILKNPFMSMNWRYLQSSLLLSKVLLNFPTDLETLYSLFYIIFVLFVETLEKVKALSSKIDAKAFNDITAFVDPIDGTREFATGKGNVSYSARL